MLHASQVLISHEQQLSRYIPASGNIIYAYITLHHHQAVVDRGSWTKFGTIQHWRRSFQCPLLLSSNAVKGHNAVEDSDVCANVGTAMSWQLAACAHMQADAVSSRMNASHVLTPPQGTGCAAEGEGHSTWQQQQPEASEPAAAAAPGLIDGQPCAQAIANLSQICISSKQPPPPPCKAQAQLHLQFYPAHAGVHAVPETC